MCFFFKQILVGIFLCFPYFGKVRSVHLPGYKCYYHSTYRGYNPQLPTYKAIYRGSFTPFISGDGAHLGKDVSCFFLSLISHHS